MNVFPRTSLRKQMLYAVSAIPIPEATCKGVRFSRTPQVSGRAGLTPNVWLCCVELEARPTIAKTPKCVRAALCRWTTWLLRSLLPDPQRDNN